MIIYALAVGNVSVGAMFMAGVVPGLLFSGGFMVMAWYTTRKISTADLRAPEPEGIRRPDAAGGSIPRAARHYRRRHPLRRVHDHRVRQRSAFPTRCSTVFSRSRRLTFRDVYDATVYSSVASAVAGALLLTGAIVGWIMTYNGITQTVADFLLSVTTSGTVFLLLVAAIVMLIGTVMEPVPIMIALAPLLAPIAKVYDISDIHFALVFVVTCLIGMVTPPVGIVLFMVSSIANVRLERLSIAILPFVIWMVWWCC